MEFFLSFKFWKSNPYFTFKKYFIFKGFTRVAQEDHIKSKTKNINNAEIQYSEGNHKAFRKHIDFTNFRSNSLGVCDYIFYLILAARGEKIPSQAFTEHPLGIWH